MKKRARWGEKMKDKFFEYALHTPNNSNRNVMNSMLADIEEEKIKEELFQFLERQNNSVNPSVLKTWIDNVFKNFGKGATYTVRIDQSISDPLNCCVYMDDAVGMEKGSSDWDKQEIFKDIRPCVLKDGEVVYYLNPDNFLYTVDGEDISELITQQDIGDAMIEFSKFAYRIYDEDNYVYVSISNDAQAIAKDIRFSYFPFTRTEPGDCEKIYIGAFLGSVVNQRLRSLPGEILTSFPIGSFRTFAQNNGEGYEQYTFYQHTMLQCLYLIRYGSLNAQSALGQGYTNANSVCMAGNTFNSGMYYGDTEDGTKQVKFAGIEDFYGNIAPFVEGIYCNELYHIMTATKDFNDEADGYIDRGAIAVNGQTGIIETIWADTALGFIPKTYVSEDEMTENSFNENYSDDAGVYAGSVALVGGFFVSGPLAGPFFLSLGFPAAGAAPDVCARLSYYK